MRKEYINIYDEIFNFEFKNITVNQKSYISSILYDSDLLD